MVKLNREKLSCADITEASLKKLLNTETSNHIYDNTRAHINQCRECWSKWNRLRWKRSLGSEHLDELALYLGEEFNFGVDSSWALAEEWDQLAPTSIRAIESFYRSTPHYLYNLAIWQASGNRPNYVLAGMPAIQKYGCISVFDFGCGIGNDGLQLIELGLNTFMGDISEPCLDFLAWRMARRKSSGRIINLNYELFNDNFDVLWLMDVIEHLPYPIKTLSPYLLKAKLIIFDTDWSGNSNGRHPFHFPESIEQFTTELNAFNFFKDNEFDTISVWANSRAYIR